MSLFITCKFGKSNNDHLSPRLAVNIVRRIKRIRTTRNFYDLTAGKSKVASHWVTLLDTWELRIFQTTEAGKHLYPIHTSAEEGLSSLQQ